jgi:hypothetical protein
LVAEVVTDDGALRRHLWNHRYQYAPIDELEQVRDELRHKVAKANPLFVDLLDLSDDPGPVAGTSSHGGAAEPHRLAALRAWTRPRRVPARLQP